MASVQGSVNPGVYFGQVPTNPALNGVAAGISPGLAVKYSPGTGADGTDLISAVRLTFVASTAQSIDLTAMADLFGAAANFARIRFLSVKMNSLVDGATLTVGAAGVNPWTGLLNATGTLTLQASSAANPNGSWLLLAAPNTTAFAVSGTSKILLFTPNAFAFTADVTIVGSSV